MDQREREREGSQERLFVGNNTTESVCYWETVIRQTRDTRQVQHVNRLTLNKDLQIIQRRGIWKQIIRALFSLSLLGGQDKNFSSFLCISSHFSLNFVIVSSLWSSKWMSCTIKRDFFVFRLLLFCGLIDQFQVGFSLNVVLKNPNATKQEITKSGLCQHPPPKILVAHPL